LLKVSQDLRHRDKEVCLPKISPSYIFFNLSYAQFVLQVAVGEGFEPPQSS